MADEVDADQARGEVAKHGTNQHVRGADILTNYGELGIDRRRLREWVLVALAQGGFRHLVHAIAGDFKRLEGGRAEPISRGLYRDSNFYDARGTFHLFNTCNTWTARMLRAGSVNL